MWLLWYPSHLGILEVIISIKIYIRVVVISLQNGVFFSVNYKNKILIEEFD